MASRDDIWLVDFGDSSPGEPAHHRRALVVGPAPVFGTNFPFAIVVPMTTTRRALALHVEGEPTTTTASTRPATSNASCSARSTPDA